MAKCWPVALAVEHPGDLLSVSFCWTSGNSRSRNSFRGWRWLAKTRAPELLTLQDMGYETTHDTTRDDTRRHETT